MGDLPGLVHIDQWVMRVMEPAEGGPHPVILLLHGWTGDEGAMWVFAGRLPKNALCLAPRGLYPAPLGGYSWCPVGLDAWPALEDFCLAVEALLGLLTPAHFPGADFANLKVVGFSQGAALAYSLAILHPRRLVALAGLSGFLPAKADPWLAPALLDGLPVFIAHGTLDDLVPVEHARQAAEALENAGGQVSYCEEAVGHKLGANCFRSLGAFLAARHPRQNG